MVLKEFRQLRRDRRTVALMVFLPVVMLIIFGYAASFDVKRIPTIVVGPLDHAAPLIKPPLHVTEHDSSGGRSLAVERLRDGKEVVAIVTGSGPPQELIDGSELFSARQAVAVFQQSSSAAGATERPTVQVLFNPHLKTSAVLVPGLAGLILAFVGTVITSLGVVRERQAGTLEQLAVMPFAPRDVIVGKIAPYFLVGTVDLVLTVGLGVTVFGVPFHGSFVPLALAGLLFLFVTLGIGVLISTVSENQGQAIQLALMTLLPQILLSGLIFPVSSMAPGVRWLAYVLPLKYFVDIARGVMLRAAPIGSLWLPLAMLAALGAVVFGLAVLRFRRDLAPAARREPAAVPA